MKIGKLLALTQKESLEEIAKRHLTIGKTAARQALKNAGCYSRRGARGWYHDNLREVEERSIYDFAAARKPRTKKETDHTKTKRELTDNTHVHTTSKIKESSSNENDYDLDAIDRILFREELERDTKIYRGFYWDVDIIDIIDSVAQCNKSELMNEIVRSVLKEKGLLN